MLGRDSKKLVCIKILLEKELFNWSVGICLWLQKLIFELCRWLLKVEGRPVRDSLLMWFMAAPRRQNLSVDLWQRMGQRSCNRAAKYLGWTDQGSWPRPAAHMSHPHQPMMLSVLRRTSSHCTGETSVPQLLTASHICPLNLNKQTNK